MQMLKATLQFVDQFSEKIIRLVRLPYERRASDRNTLEMFLFVKGQWLLFGRALRF